MPEVNILEEEYDVESRKHVFISLFKEFIKQKYNNEITQASLDESALVIDFSVLDKFSPTLANVLLDRPDFFFEICRDSMKEIDIPNPVNARFSNLPDTTNVRDLRSKHLGRFVCTEGIVRRASEIRPEIVESEWECAECEEKISVPVVISLVSKPFECPNGSCRNRSRFVQKGKRKLDVRWVTIEEPFELTEGERPSQVNVLLKEDLTSPEGRRITDPGNRLRINGVLKDIPKGKSFSAKLDFYLEANYVEPTEIGWERVEITEEDKKEIEKVAKNPNVYKKLVASLAPSLYGLKDVKEGIILQLFGGVPRTLKDKIHFRGDIHVLLIGDPASGKSQLMKLVPEVVPRGRYVSGKGVTGAGLTATVTKDEQFMGGWVLEAGALVLSNKGLLSIDEFEKMAEYDQVAMHEALEQGTISIAKASIVATLPAKTSVLAGGNPKFSRFDPYQSVGKQITIPDTLLSRFDLKFALKDIPDSEEDKKIVDHILRSREEDYEASKPVFPAEFMRKYIAYAKNEIKPKLSVESGRMLKKFYTLTRKKAEGGNAPIPITLRQFESLIRLSEASAKIQLSNSVRKEDAERAIRIMRVSLKQLGFDPETGQIDIDKSEGGTTFTERSRIKTVLEIINRLSQKKKEISLEELVSEAKKEEIDEVDDIIERLKREGMLFEPTPGYVQKV